MNPTPEKDNISKDFTSDEEKSKFFQEFLNFSKIPSNQIDFYQNVKKIQTRNVKFVRIFMEQNGYTHSTLLRNFQKFLDWKKQILTNSVQPQNENQKKTDISKNPEEQKVQEKKSLKKFCYDIVVFKEMKEYQLIHCLVRALRMASKDNNDNSEKKDSNFGDWIVDIDFAPVFNRVKYSHIVKKRISQNFGNENSGKVKPGYGVPLEKFQNFMKIAENEEALFLEYDGDCDEDKPLFFEGGLDGFIDLLDQRHKSAKSRIDLCFN